MKKLVVLSYGHGENTFPETGSKGVIVDGKRYAEHTTNAKIGEMTRKIVEAHGIKTLVVQPPNDRDVPLRTRTNKANASGASLYYSFHSNAGPKSARGMCAFYWGTSKEGKELAQYYAKLCKEEGLPLYSGGTYASVKGTWTDFHELRETNMVAILSENLFMTNPDDFQLLFKNKDNFHERSAVIHAKVILKFFGVTYKEETKKSAPEKPKSSTIYRVRKSKDDAESQKGAFSNLESAKDLADKNPGYEVYDQNGKLIYTPKQETKASSTPKKVAPAPKKEASKPKSSGGIKSVGKIKIVNVNSAAIIMDKPDAKKSKNLGTIGKGKTIEVAGSVKGKNSDSGYWEVIYNGKRAYVTGKMGQMV